MMTATRTRQTDDERAKARQSFLYVIEERLRERMAKGESYTTTSDLARGFEELHRSGFSDTVTTGQSVMSVLNRSEYRGRLFYARNVVTHKAERSGPGRYAPYRVYLRADAVPPQGYVLVPMEADKSEIAAAVAAARAAGERDTTLHVTPTAPRRVVMHRRRSTDRAEGVTAPALVDDNIDYKAVSERLTSVIKAQADIIDTILPVLALTHR